MVDDEIRAVYDAPRERIGGNRTEESRQFVFCQRLPILAQTRCTPNKAIVSAHSS